MRRLVTILVGFPLAAAAAPAFAGGSQDADVAAESPIDHAASHDPASGRSYAMGTALTQKEGTFTLTWRQPSGPAGYVSITGALSDRIELTTGLGYILGNQDGSGRVPSFSLKAQVWRGDIAALAIQAGSFAPPASGSSTSAGHVDFVSVLGSSCGGPTCGTLISAHVTAMRVPDSTGDQLVVFGGGSFSAGNDDARFLVELDVAQIDQNSDLGALVLAGGRFPFRVWSLDAALGALVDPSDHELPFIPMLYLATSIRL